jgi:hypothetical protein
MTTTNATTVTNSTTVPKTNIDLEQLNMDNDNDNNYQVKWSILDKIINISQNPTTTTTTTNTTPSMNLSQGSNQTISNITDLQTIEMKLYASLDNNKLTADQRSLIIDKINQIAQTRMTLYQGISNMASSYQQTLATSNNSLQEQILAIDIVENELNQAKRRLNMLESQKNNKLRMVEINTYYGKQYSAYKDIAKDIVYVCILVLIVLILGKKGIIPTNIYITLNGIIITIGVVIIGNQVIKLSNKDNMNYDEYNWYFNKSAAPPPPPTSSSSSSSSNPWASSSIACVGATCCDQSKGFTYDSTQNMCIITSPTSTDTTSTDTTSTDTTSTNTSS